MDSTDALVWEFAFLSCTVIAIITGAVIIHFARRKGVNIYKHSWMTKLILFILAIVLAPIWILPTMTFSSKIWIIIVVFVFGVVNYFALDRGGKKFRRALRLKESKWEREERELIEKDARLYESKKNI